MTAGRVFISHSSDNRELASELAAFLEKNGARVWIAPRDVRPGMDYSEQLQRAIEECIAFVVLVTDQANKSPYVRAETEMAFSTHKPLFPIRMSDIQPAPGLALFLKIRHWTDAYGPSRQDNLAQLAREIRALSGLTQIGDTPTTPPGDTPAAPPAAPAPPTETTAPPDQMTAPPATAVPPQAGPVLASTPAAPDTPAYVPPPPPPPLPTSEADEELWRAAIGRNADYFLSHWRKMDEKGRSWDWNWAACFANLFWLAYRKLWLALAIFIVASIVLSVVGGASGSPRLALFLSIAPTFVSGYFGNLWYRRQTERLVAKGISGAMSRAEIESKGGVSIPAMVVLIVITVVLTLLAILGTMAQMRQQQEAQNQLNALNAPPADDGGGDVGDKPVDGEEPVIDEQPEY